jgi:hypothetical protein
MAGILQSRRNLMVKRMRGLFVASLLVAAAPVLAQMGMRPPQFSGVWNPVVGGGAVYEVSNAQGGKSEISISIVGKEDVNGKTGYWMASRATCRALPLSTVRKPISKEW